MIPKGLAVLLGLACSGESATAPPTPVDATTLQATYDVTLTRVSHPQSPVFACAPIVLAFERNITWDARGCGADLVSTGVRLPPGAVEVWTREEPRYRGFRFTSIVGDSRRRRLESDWEGRTCSGLVTFPPEPCVVETGTAVWLAR